MFKSRLIGRQKWAAVVKRYIVAARTAEISTLIFPQSNYISGGVRPLCSLLPVIAIPRDTKCGEYILPDATGAKLAVSGMCWKMMLVVIS